jgi:hypothetical protein
LEPSSPSRSSDRISGGLTIIGIVLLIGIVKDIGIVFLPSRQRVPTQNVFFDKLAPSRKPELSASVDEPQPARYP